MTIGDRIEQRRKALGIASQSALARMADMGQSTLNGLIRHDYRWSPFLPRLARELQTTVQFLVGDTDDPDGSALPSRPSPPPTIMMPVTLPSEDSLAEMFHGLLDAIGRPLGTAELARELAQLLPTGLSQALLQPSAPHRHSSKRARSAAAPANAVLEPTR